MKIAQIAPLTERVPPRFYGGTERVVSYLTEELVRRGHDVSLFASGDSVTAATLVPGAPKALRLEHSVEDPLPHIMLLLEKVRMRVLEFDVLHFHTEILHFPMFRPHAMRCVTTLHGRLDRPDVWPFYREFSDMPVVSISDDQRRPVPWANWIATIHHGLPTGITCFNGSPKGDYLAFLGRIAPEKRPDRAIRIARKAGMKLRIAAKIDPVDAAYFAREIQPLLDSPWVEWVGEIAEHDKPEFLGNARALLFPIDWPEPFGLVVIEAMASGTPTIAYRRGSVPEIVAHGVNGWIVDDEEGAVEAVRKLDMLDRAVVRECFERRFTVARMADDYLKVYGMLAQEGNPAVPVGTAGKAAWI